MVHMLSKEPQLSKQTFGKEVSQVLVSHWKSESANLHVLMTYLLFGGLNSHPGKIDCEECVHVSRNDCWKPWVLEDKAMV